LTQIKAEADKTGIDLAEAFKGAGDMGIAGLVQGLASSSSAEAMAGSVGA